jgi:NADPH-dependent glutamate synthase beta subunit-like oxidoreductase
MVTELDKALDRITEKCIGESLPYCQAECPLHIDVKGYTGLIREGKFSESLRLIREKLPFPEIIGRICTHPCETKCKRREVDEAIAINALKRSAAQYGQPIDEDLTIAEEKTARVAIVGGGPAGLMAAHDLRRTGYQVTIFEALPVLGGMLAVGIPEFRLPRDILQKESGIIGKLGVEVRPNTMIGTDVKLADIRQDFDAVFIATGTQLSQRLSIEGTELEGVLWGMDFLREVNLGRQVEIKERVAVIGGGNVAVDVALTALRLGAKSVQLACLESREEMPAFEWEIEQALEEGVAINPGFGPRRILGSDNKVTGIELVGCISVFDEEGRFNPCLDESVSNVIEADMVILAIGQAADLSFLGENSGIKPANAGLITVNSITLETGVPGVFAGGDVVGGPKSVIDALAAGRKVAISIDRYIKGEDLALERDGEGAQETNLTVSVEGIQQHKRVSPPALPLDQRRGNFREVESGFTMEQAREEAERCLQCECRLCVRDCEFLQRYRQNPKELVERFKAGEFRENPLIPYSCNLCSLCESRCPQDLSMADVNLELRRALVAEGRGPLPQHKFLDWNLNWTNSDKFTLAQPGSETGETKRVFFPGCNLSAYSPTLVFKTYEYLRQRLPGTGIVLNCCGRPACDLGQQDRFQEIQSKIASQMAELGATEVITACPNCYMIFKKFAPDIKVRSVYEVMVELGLPYEAEAKAKEERIFSLHDSCSVRWEKDLQDSVRTLLNMMGYRIEEMEHTRESTICCGIGGMVPYIDIGLAFKAAKRRAEEAHFDLITYCATCREQFANPEAAGKPCLHVLDLVFNPDWEQARLSSPNIGATKRENQAKLKTLIQEKLLV